jgi:hypothetical protein
MKYRDYRHSAPPRSTQEQAKDVLFALGLRAYLEYQAPLGGILHSRQKSPYGPGEYLQKHTTPEQRALFAILTSDDHVDGFPWFLRWERRLGHPDRLEGDVLETRPTTYYRFARSLVERCLSQESDNT